ncbi:MAG: EscU/YscU/HrcU family type III secretion system export apparatus switch protein [bacterium]
MKDLPDTPRRRAVALRYQHGVDQAPVVVAAGQGTIADKIVTIAQEHNVPLYQDPDLVELLSTVDLGRSIPTDLYKAVAEILAYVYTINQTSLKR